MERIIPTVDDVVAASERLRGWLVETPVLESAALNERLGTRVLLKAECLQHAGSFKIRGTMNRVLALSHDERSNGIVAYSSGNHAQAVALAARWLGAHATVVMPADAPATKKRRVQQLGAEIVLYDRYREDREEIATGIADQRGAALVPPFEHHDVVAGQGTAGLELAAAARQRRVELGAVYVPCSGGGLIAGCALALRDTFPSCAMHAVEPEGYDDMKASLDAGARRFVTPAGATICDGLQAATPGAVAFAICRELVADAHAVSDDDVMRAMAFAADDLKVVLEPSGAAALAWVLRDRSAIPQHRGKSEGIGVILSGGNVDRDVWTTALAKYPDD